MNAYIIAGYRTAVGKANKGGFRFVRPDDLAAKVIEHLMAQYPQIDKEEIDDVIVGNAMPEGEQGLNMGRLISLIGLHTDKVPGMTVNRYCSSGLETIAIASAKIHSGMADCIIAGGAESMSAVPMGGWRIVPNAGVSAENPDYYWGMGLTAEQVAKEFNVSREDQDAFAFNSHQKAINAIEKELFKNEIVPFTTPYNYVNDEGKLVKSSFTVATDEGPRKDTTLDALAKLKPVFSATGSVTAGNASQTSDGAAFVLVCSEAFIKKHNLKPIAQLKSYSVVGVPPRIMGIGPIDAIPKAVKAAGLNLQDINLFELNEAFASQSLAVVRETGINPDIVNVNGGAIALGHPLGCSGAKLSVQIMNELQRRKQKYGVVTMCVGTGQGAAGVFEML